MMLPVKLNLLKEKKCIYDSYIVWITRPIFKYSGLASYNLIKTASFKKKFLFI